MDVAFLNRSSLYLFYILNTIDCYKLSLCYWYIFSIPGHNLYEKHVKCLVKGYNCLLCQTIFVFFCPSLTEPVFSHIIGCLWENWPFSLVPGFVFVSWVSFVWIYASVLYSYLVLLCVPMVHFISFLTKHRGGFGSNYISKNPAAYVVRLFKPRNMLVNGIFFSQKNVYFTILCCVIEFDFLCLSGPIRSRPLVMITR